MADQNIEVQNTEKESQIISSINEDNEIQPTQQDWKTLPRIADHLPTVVWFVVFCELCERFTYYGVSGPFQNYIQYPPPAKLHGQPGAIGAGQETATALGYFFHFFCYVTPLIGAAIADQYLGRFNTILMFCLVYMVGLTILTTTAIPAAIQAKAAFPGLILSMIIIGLGTGGIKCNVSPLVADQYTRTKPYVKKLSDGKKVIVDPKITVQSIFHWFYLAINVGSLSPILTTYLEKYHSYWMAYLVPLIMFFGAIGVLIVFRKNYVKKPPQGSAILKFFRVLKVAFMNGRNLDNAKPSNLSKTYNITWDDKFVDEVKKCLEACRVFIFFPIYWLCYEQMSNNLVSQASVMQVGDLPNDLVMNLNPISLIIFVPLTNKIIYPAFQRFGIIIRPITRIFIGFLLCGLSMAYSAIVQHIIYKTGPCFESTGCMVDGEVVPNNVNVWVQSPSYILIGFSEVFASITGLTYAYERAPDELKSTVTALYLMTTAFGSALGFGVVPLSKDPYLVILYVTLSILVVVTGFLLLFTFKKYDQEEEQEEVELLDK
ncbi:di/tri peptide transporter 2 [Glomus cerebriforme]|uniref:Di/tri peptide transporter 2 n=1 Tax=Glomus cerebriforme TaxID=658196 RepID=A0A397TLV3_9GLOM|nr:di/tri peptide transporter 2 [Glomus cerebriforme]